MKMTEKEQLEKEKLSLEYQLFDVKTKINKILKTETKLIFERKYNGTYWRYKDCYDEKKGWFAYVHVKKITDVWDTGNGVNCRILCDVFQITHYKKLIIDIDTEIYLGSLEKKITKEEFSRAVSKIINKAKETVKQA